MSNFRSFKLTAELSSSSDSGSIMLGYLGFGVELRGTYKPVTCGHHELLQAVIRRSSKLSNLNPLSAMAVAKLRLKNLPTCADLCLNYFRVSLSFFLSFLPSFSLETGGIHLPWISEIDALDFSFSQKQNFYGPFTTLLLSNVLVPFLPFFRHSLANIENLVVSTPAAIVLSTIHKECIGCDLCLFQWNLVWRFYL